MINAPEPQDVSLRGTVIYLILGVIPIVMLVAFWLRSGTGLNLALVGYMFLLAGSFLSALNYYMFYRQHLPRSALVPAVGWKGLIIACLLLPAGAYNMLATAANVGLTLSPGPRVEGGQIVSLVAKVVSLAMSPNSVSPIKLPPHAKLDLVHNKWLIHSPFMGGALWGALGYAIPFGIAGLLFGLMRKELMDPRDEHLGSGAVAGLVRGAVGMYYGTAVGFTMGATIIWVLRTMFSSVTQATPTAVLHVMYVMGAASNPNVAFSYAFSTGCLLAGAMAIFSGRRDFTAGISDPKAPELTRPVEVNIPEIPEPPDVPFDMGRVAAESQQLLGSFQGELGKMFQGPEWDYQRYDLPPVGKVGRPAEPAATNVISANALVDDDELSAMGSLGGVYVQIVVDLGKLEIPAADWLCLREGAILELPRSQDSAVNVSINGRAAGRGRPMTINGNKAVKMVQVGAEAERLARAAGG